MLARASLWLMAGAVCLALLTGARVWAQDEAAEGVATEVLDVDPAGPMPETDPVGPPPDTQPADPEPAEPPAKAGPTPVKPAPDPAKPTSMLEAQRTRFDKQLGDIEKRLSEIQQEEFELSTKILKAQQKALEGIEKPGKIEEELAKGKGSKELDEYKKIQLLCIGELKAHDGKYAALQRQAAPLPRMAERLGDETYKTRVQELQERIWRARRANLERIAGMYKSIADYRTAMNVYMMIYQNLPEEQREGPEGETLKKIVLDLKKKVEGAEAKKEGGEKEKEKKKEEEKKAWK